MVFPLEQLEKFSSFNKFRKLKLFYETIFDSSQNEVDRTELFIRIIYQVNFANLV